MYCCLTQIQLILAPPMLQISPTTTTLVQKRTFSDQNPDQFPQKKSVNGPQSGKTDLIGGTAHPRLWRFLTSSLQTSSQFLRMCKDIRILGVCKTCLIFTVPCCIYSSHCHIACIPLQHVVLCTDIASAVKMRVYRVCVQNSCTVTGQLSDRKTLRM